MENSLLYASERSGWRSRTSLLVVAGLAAFCAGLGALVVAESGVVPGMGRPVSADVRLVLGAQGVALCLVGALVVAGSGPRLKKRPEQALFRFYGLSRLRSGDEFQTFSGGPGETGPIQAMWADAATNSRVCARVDANGKFLRLEFLNECANRPCSVSIRSMGGAALLNAPSGRYLQFQARVPTCEPRYARPGPHNVRDNLQEFANAPKRAQSVALTVRLVNGALQHWTWQGRAREPKRWVIAGQGWKTIKMPLNEGWARFSGEGNPEGPSRPDLSVLAAAIFEVGAEGDFPDGAYGVVDIRDIRCAD